MGAQQCHRSQLWCKAGCRFQARLAACNAVLCRQAAWPAKGQCLACRACAAGQILHGRGPAVRVLFGRWRPDRMPSLNMQAAACRGAFPV